MSGDANANQESPLGRASTNPEEPSKGRGLLAGRVALVTGAGSGIGRAVAVRLAEEGATVAVASLTAQHVKETCQEVQRASGSEAFPLVLDITDAAAVEDAVARVADRFQHIDILSNNAGTSLFHSPSVLDTTDHEWEQLFRINVTGMFYVCRSAIPVMTDGGSIINIGSIASILAAENDSAYTATKGAVLQFTRALALDLANRRIRANCVCPGITQTPAMERYLVQADDRDAELSAYASFSPQNRIGTSREVANCVLFLASDESSLVNGTALMADGGSSIR